MELLEETIESLKRIQTFDAQKISRSKELGEKFHFEEAIEPANKLIRLYNQLSVTVLEDFPDNILTEIKNQSNADFNRIQQILDFDPSTIQNPSGTRDSHINNLTGAYQGTFQKLYNYIAYGVSKATDFQRMENEARSMIQSVKDQANNITQELEEDQKSAENILKDVRKVAAEQGVSQQAIYFKEEADNHEKLADEWKKNSIWLSIILGIYAIASLFIHKIPFLTPTDTFQSFQLISSKILIFAVIAYLLFISAKNFLSHKHNSIVNRHRQNALMTFKALSDATINGESKDIVLTHASSCIFSPQETGYTNQNNTNSNKTSVIEMLPKTAIKVD